MKLSAGINILNSRKLDKKLSKKITLANTSDKVIDKKAQRKAESSPSDPYYFTNGNSQQVFNPDIRYRTDFAYSPLTGINYRNDLIIFAENNEVKKAVGIVANECVIIDTQINKYPVSPQINKTLVDKEKHQVADAIQDYLDKVFYPKMYQWYDFKENGLIRVIEEFLITGKICYEIIYDNLNNPKDIIGFQPIDPSTIQKIKHNDMIYYVQRPIVGMSNGERILHENQIILCEWNEYDYGYVSYVDKLRRSFNIMRSMQTSKVLWFATKSQVRMHIKLALGDVTRPEAITKLTEAKNQYINQYTFEDDGIVRFNNEPNNSGYREFFTAETAASGSPEIEEVNANGPDLTETDSLNYWSKLFWSDTEIPYDRIDPSSGDTWGFTDVNNLRKIEINFSKFINKIRKMINDIFRKPIIIQLTLKEVEIGVDLSLLDSIIIDWVAFNQYDKLAEIEVLNKKVELATNISNFGEYTDVNDKTRKIIPYMWIIKNILDLTKEQTDSMEDDRKIENVMLGFNEDGSDPNGDMEDDEEYSDEEDEYVDAEDEDTTEDYSIINLIKSGQIDKSEIKSLIDAGQLTEEEIDELVTEGLYEESPEDIANSDDNEY